MIKWCCYCQQFIREISPFEDFGITHGVCIKCEDAHDNLFAEDVVARGEFLRKIFQRLFDAGRRDNVPLAIAAIDEAVAANCRPVDILMGMVAPMLYEIGEEWERSALSVEGEHRFTAFCEKVIDLVALRVHASDRASPSSLPLLFLMNAPGNMHLLALRILALWLGGLGAVVRIVDQAIDTDDLLQLISAERPKYLLISMSLLEQREAVIAIAAAAQTLPEHSRPRTVVGGYPVKVGLIRSIPTAELIPDISELRLN